MGGAMPITPSLRLGRIAGIEVGVHYSWLFFGALITWSLAAGYFPETHPGWSAATYWLAGTLAALALFVSVMLHELAHSLVARARGAEVQRVTLFIFGGVATIKDEPASAADEFMIAIVGPLTSFLIAGTCWAAAAALGVAGGAAAARAAPAAVLGYLAVINALLGGFNLLPGFPLDGGRVLRAALWAATKDLRRATDLASYAGQGIGLLLVFVGISRALSGAVLNGLWTTFMGWFLSGTAEATRRGFALREGLRGVRVAEYMDAQPDVATADMSVAEFVFRHVLGHGKRALPVIAGAEEHRLVGIVGVTDIKEVPQPAWPATAVSEIMHRPPLKTVSPTTEINTALRRMVEDGLNQLPVVEDGRLVGMLSRADVLRSLQLQEELHVTPGGRPATPRQLVTSINQASGDIGQPKPRAAA